MKTMNHLKKNTCLPGSSNSKYTDQTKALFSMTRAMFPQWSAKGMQRQSQIRLCYCTTITGYMFKSGFLETWLISNPWPVTYDAYSLLICVIHPKDNEAICTHNLIQNFQLTVRDGNLHATSFKKTEANPLHQDCLSIATGQGFQ